MRILAKISYKKWVARKLRGRWGKKGVAGRNKVLLGDKTCCWAKKGFAGQKWVAGKNKESLSKKEG